MVSVDRWSLYAGVLAQLKWAMSHAAYTVVSTGDLYVQVHGLSMKIYCISNVRNTMHALAQD